MKRKMWNVQEERELKKLIKEKHSIEIIAIKLKRSKKAISMKLSSLGLLDEEEAKKISASSSSSAIFQFPFIGISPCIFDFTQNSEDKRITFNSRSLGFLHASQLSTVEQTQLQ